MFQCQFQSQTALLCILLLPCCSLAQAIPSPAIPANPATGLSGPTKAMQGLPEMRIKSSILDSKKSVENILKEHGLKPEENSIEMFYRMNPEFRNKSTIPENSTFNIILPNTEVSGSPHSINIDTQYQRKDLTRAYGELLSKQAGANVLKASSLPLSAYASQADRSKHLQALSQIEQASINFEKKAPTLSGLEYALMADRLDYANRKAQEIENVAQSGQQVQSGLIQKLDRFIGFLMPSSTEEKLTRKVTVEVQDQAGNAVSGLMVYSLPGPFFEDPKAYDKAMIKSRLIRYSFVNLTSPASAEVDGIDARLWVGPARKYDAMVDMIMNSRLTGKYSTLNDKTLGKKDLKLILKTPNDIVFLE